MISSRKFKDFLAGSGAAGVADDADDATNAPFAVARAPFVAT